MKSPDLPAGFLSRPFAHRGLHGAGCPENSLPAFGAAITAGYGIELDVQESADGEAVVFHDATLDRMTGATGPVRARRLADLTQLDLRGGQTRLPSLPDALALIAGRVPLLVEVKDQHGALGPVSARLEAAVARALRDYPGPVAVMSFNPHSMAAMARLAPGIPRGLTTCAFTASDWPGVPGRRRARLRRITDFGAVGASFVSHDWTDLGNPALAGLRARKIPVLCWTIRTAEQAAQALTAAQAITFEGFTPA